MSFWKQLELKVAGRPLKLLLSISFTVFWSSSVLGGEDITHYQGVYLETRVPGEEAIQARKIQPDFFEELFQIPSPGRPLALRVPGRRGSPFYSDRALSELQIISAEKVTKIIVNHPNASLARLDMLVLGFDYFPNHLEYSAVHPSDYQRIPCCNRLLPLTVTRDGWRGNLMKSSWGFSADQFRIKNVSFSRKEYSEGQGDYFFIASQSGTIGGGDPREIDAFGLVILLSNGDHFPFLTRKGALRLYTKFAERKDLQDIERARILAKKIVTTGDIGNMLDVLNISRRTKLYQVGIDAVRQHGIPYHEARGAWNPYQERRFEEIMTNLKK